MQNVVAFNLQASNGSTLYITWALGMLRAPLLIGDPGIMSIFGLNSTLI